MLRSVYRFHVYYHVRRVFERLQVSLPYESGFNAADNPYSSEGFFQICEDHDIPRDPVRYGDESYIGLISEV